MSQVRHDASRGHDMHFFDRRVLLYMSDDFDKPDSPLNKNTKVSACTCVWMPVFECVDVSVSVCVIMLCSILWQRYVLSKLIGLAIQSMTMMKEVRAGKCRAWYMHMADNHQRRILTSSRSSCCCLSTYARSFIARHRISITKMDMTLMRMFPWPKPYPTCGASIRNLQSFAKRNKIKGYSSFR